MLSIICVLITCWIIVRYRTCSKHDAGHDATRNTTSPIPAQSATCNLDLHEMQNLIAKAETLAPNGLIRHSGNGNNATDRIMLTSSTPKKVRNEEDFSCTVKVYTKFSFCLANLPEQKKSFRLRTMSSIQNQISYILFRTWERIKVMALLALMKILRFYLIKYIPIQTKYSQQHPQMEIYEHPQILR